MRLVGFAAVALLALTGCSETIISPPDGNTDAQYQSWAPADRVAPTEFSTTYDDGAKVDSASLDGKITVINFWYAGCAPCRVEAPLLQSVHEKYPDVQFIGVNTRDAKAEADAFDKKFGVTYPTVLDGDKGDFIYAFAGKRPANSTPTTFVLDDQGRVYARILGQLEDASILSTYIDDLVTEEKK